MTEAKGEIKELRKIKETFVAAAQAAYDATERITSQKPVHPVEPKK
jgi:hypothetical protein